MGPTKGPTTNESATGFVIRLPPKTTRGIVSHLSVCEACGLGPDQRFDGRAMIAPTSVAPSSLWGRTVSRTASRTLDALQSRGTGATEGPATRPIANCSPSRSYRQPTFGSGSDGKARPGCSNHLFLTPVWRPFGACTGKKPFTVTLRRGSNELPVQRRLPAGAEEQTQEAPPSRLAQRRTAWEGYRPWHRWDRWSPQGGRHRP